MGHDLVSTDLYSSDQSSASVSASVSDSHSHKSTSMTPENSINPTPSNIYGIARFSSYGALSMALNELDGKCNIFNDFVNFDKIKSINGFISNDIDLLPLKAEIVKHSSTSSNFLNGGTNHLNNDQIHNNSSQQQKISRFVFSPHNDLPPLSTSTTLPSNSSTNQQSNSPTNDFFSPTNSSPPNSQYDLQTNINSHFPPLISGKSILLESKKKDDEEYSDLIGDRLRWAINNSNPNPNLNQNSNSNNNIQLDSSNPNPMENSLENSNSQLPIVPPPNQSISPRHGLMGISINTTNLSSTNSNIPTPQSAPVLWDRRRQVSVSGYPSSSNQLTNHMLPQITPIVENSQHSSNRIPPAANPADQNPPCNTLYVGNLPMNTSEDELKNIFQTQLGYKRLCFRNKTNGPMCFVEFDDVAYATRAMNELYGSVLTNSIKGGIRLSFSKNPLGVRSNNTNGNNSTNGSISGHHSYGLNSNINGSLNRPSVGNFRHSSIAGYNSSSISNIGSSNSNINNNVNLNGFQFNSQQPQQQTINSGILGFGSNNQQQQINQLPVSTPSQGLGQLPF